MIVAIALVDWWTLPLCVARPRVLASHYAHGWLLPRPALVVICVIYAVLTEVFGSLEGAAPKRILRHLIYEVIRSPSRTPQPASVGSD
jgi:hypothetical protein